MARKTDLQLLRLKVAADIIHLENRFTMFSDILTDKEYDLLQWISSMSVVELHAIWERFVEDRLIIALNHHPKFFIEENSIKGNKVISYGLAKVIVRGNSKYFDFRSTGELIDKGNKSLATKNPFLALKSSPNTEYLDALSAIRNCIVHSSDISISRYKKTVRKTFDLKYVPLPEEFLNAIDNRKASPTRFRKRLMVLSEVVKKTVRDV